jgi:hypothetical protein
MATYFRPLLEGSTQDLIGNVRTELVFMEAQGHLIPITVNDTEWDNSYVASPYTHYVTYAKEELERLHNPALEGILAEVLNIIGLGFRRARFNRVVHVNNWLLSTNLGPPLPGPVCAAITKALTERYPGHTIVFRSLNQRLTSSTLAELKALGYIPVPSRQIYIMDPAGRPASSKARWLVKRDYGLIAKHGYTVARPEDMMEEDVFRMTELYQMLYRGKYSLCNPDFTPEYIRHAMKHGSLQLYGLRKNGRLDAVLGFFRREGVMTTPLFGYDLGLPQDVGLYRMLSALLVRHAEETGHILHESSGAAQFKRNRGAEPDIEYSAVHIRHLPFFRRLPWLTLSVLLNRIGVPIIRKYKL